MPNHCCTNLTITGPVSDINSFIKAVDNSKNKQYDFFNVNGLVPMPEELIVGDTQTDDVDNWHNWAAKNWGTIKGIYDSTSWDFDKTNGDNGYALISYHTAYCPANQFFITASKMYPTLMFRFEYAVEGGGVVCDAVCKNGEYSENEYDWDSNEGIKIRENVGLYYPDDEDDFSNN